MGKDGRKEKRKERKKEREESRKTWEEPKGKPGNHKVRREIEARKERKEEALRYNQSD